MQITSYHNYIFVDDAPVLQNSGAVPLIFNFKKRCKYHSHCPSYNQQYLLLRGIRIGSSNSFRLNIPVKNSSLKLFKMVVTQNSKFKPVFDRALNLSGF